jgi:type VI secretion system protein ImpG
VRSAVRLRLRALAGLTFDRLPMDSLVLFLRGVGDAGARLYEQIVGGAAGVLVRSTQNPSARERLQPGCVRRVGFDDDQALLPYGRRSFRGYRLLHEYFTLPGGIWSNQVTSAMVACELGGASSTQRIPSPNGPSKRSSKPSASM